MCLPLGNAEDRCHLAGGMKALQEPFSFTYLARLFKKCVFLCPRNTSHSCQSVFVSQPFKLLETMNPSSWAVNSSIFISQYFKAYRSPNPGQICLGPCICSSQWIVQVNRVPFLNMNREQIIYPLLQGFAYQLEPGHYLLHPKVVVAIVPAMGHLVR